MLDSLDTPNSEKESSNAINYLIAGCGLLFMLCACSLIPLILARNNFQPSFPTASNSEPDAPFVYTGQQVHNVPAGARSITALSHSNEAPVIVMFDADW